ncbi:MAG: prolipoprotein diacylglyceryl transferase [Lachnospiraceae bacterium]|nr:prolipoprotein diacylglyceryl transferase [Lachnospiraceae bacterium]
MNYSINFPHLGIHLEHVPKSFSIFGFDIALYGVCIAIGMILAFVIMDKTSKVFLAKPDDYFDVAIVTVIVGIIGARVYYVAFEWEHYKGSFLSIINIREGGLAIYGGVIGGVLAAVIMSRIKKINSLDILDTFFPGVVVGQIVGRWGNFFNREAFSKYTDGLFAMQLPVDAVRRHEITDAMWENLQTIDGIDYIQVTPNFLYEGMWNVLVFIVLIVLVKRRIFKGQIALTYAVMYGAGRFYLEGLRTDQLQIGNTGLAVSQLVGLSCAVVGIAIYAYVLIKKKPTKISEENIQD